MFKNFSQGISLFLTTKNLKWFFCAKIILILLFIATCPEAKASPGDFAIYRDSLGNGLIENQDWNITEIEDASFSISTDRESIDLSEGGHYLALYNLALISTGGTNRSEIQGIINLAGIDLEYGRASCFIRRGSDADECWMMGSAIINVSPGDDLKIRSIRTDSNLSASVGRIADESGVSVLKLDDSWPYLRTRDATGGQAFNSYNFTPVFWDANDEIDISHFSRSGGDIVLALAGYYLVSSNVMFYNSSTNARRNNETRFTLDNIEIPGTRTSAYLRGSNSTQQHATTWVGIIKTNSNNQTLRLEGACEGEACGGVTNIGGQTALSIVKLPDSGEYLRLGELAGGQVVNAVNDPILFDTNFEVASSFSHIENTSIVNINTEGDYLFFGSFYNLRSSPLNARLYPHWEWRRNGSLKMPFSGFGKYNRGDQSTTGTFSSGNSGVILLNDLVSSDFIELVNTNETSAVDASATFNSNLIGMQAVNLRSIFPQTNKNIEQLNFRWRDDSCALNTSCGWRGVENSNSIGVVAKNETYRLRIESANTGESDDAVSRSYVLQWADKNGVPGCSSATSWNDIDMGDGFFMDNSVLINPDGQSITSSLLTNNSGLIFSGGEARDVLNTTGTTAPLGQDEYFEFEYSITPSSLAISGHTYCFRMFDAENGVKLDSYSNYPELTIEKIGSSIPVAEWGFEDGVSDSAWTTVNFAKDYNDPVFLCSANYANNIGFEADGTADSIVCRVQNVGSTSAQVRLQEAGNIAPSLTNTEKIYWTVVESGSFDTDDIKIEAFKYNSTVTDGKNSWIGEEQNYNLLYSSPIVLGQVMSYNDPNWSVFWARGSSRTALPSPTSLYTGKNVAEDLNNIRNDEIVGVVVIESGIGELSGIKYEANNTNKVIDRIDDNPPQQFNFTQNFSASPEVAVISQIAISGNDGPHPVFYGLNPLTISAMNLSIMEDEITDTEQRGNTESTAFAVFENVGSYETGAYIDQTTFRFFENADSIQPGVALANENNRLDDVLNGDIVRLRVSLQASEDLSLGITSFKLQYGLGGDCSGIDTWNDVGGIGGAEPWRGYDNLNAISQSQITTSMLDYKNNYLEVYSEDGNSVANLNLLSSGERGEWDFVLENNNALSGSQYCFRVVLANSEVIQYTNYASLTTAGGAGSLDVLAPEFANLSKSSFSFSSQINSGNNLGVVNASDDRVSSPGWSINITGEDWLSDEGNIMDYDGDGISSGQLEINLDNVSIVANLGSTSGVASGATDSFTSTTQVINLITANPGHGTGDYDINNIELKQIIPGNQNTGVYDMTLVFTIS